MEKVDVLIGMQFGSEGKGLIAGFLAKEEGYDMVVNVNMPNAGHTYITDSGKEYMFKVLPNGAVHENIKRVMLGPDSVFSPERLLIEMQMIGGDIWSKLRIHENATMLRPEHTIGEQSSNIMNRIGSTAQGSSLAMIDKISRFPEAVVKFDPGEFGANVISEAEWQAELRMANKILLEGCQGWSLSLNSGFYPYCTSRDCTPGRLMSGARIPHHWINRVIGAARLFPIRVGGNSGPGYPDQTEITWEELGLNPEFTTVTQRKRRVFTFSAMQIADCVAHCGVDDIFLNFCNYRPELVPGIIDTINSVCDAHAPGWDSKVTYTGWGPKHGDVVYEG